MTNSLGITQEGLDTALKLKGDYKNHRPLMIPGDAARMLIPENLLNHNIDLSGLDDPLPLAMVAVRDPEAPMALAATARLCPLAGKTKLISGVAQLVSESSKHELVRECLSFVSDKAFDPGAIAEVRRHASKYIVETPVSGASQSSSVSTKRSRWWPARSSRRPCRPRKGQS